MKFLKLSLAASVALGAFSTASFAQPLEEAIKGIDVSGYLRYRYNDDRYDNGNDDVSGSTARHQWRAVADFKTPVINNVAINLGVWYNNTTNNVNHENEAGLGNGLGAGSDGSFGVRTFYATITPDSTATTIMIGKQELNTPVTNAYNGDRGTGILALNNDIEGLTLAAGAFDSWSINEMDATTWTSDTTGGWIEGSSSISDRSVTKPLYTLAGIYNVDTAYGNFGGQLWGFYIQDAVDALVFGELSWKGSMFRAKAQYTYASLDNDYDSIFGSLYSGVDPSTGKPAGVGAHGNKADIAESNDLAVIELGANFKNDFQLPLDMRIGYITNFADGTAVSLEDEGTNVSRAGKIWWQNAATGISTSALRKSTGGVWGFGSEQDVDVFYANVNYGFIDERLNLGLDFAWGRNKVSYANSTYTEKTEFTEITPTISWKHSKQLTLSTYYAFLSTDWSDNVAANKDESQDRNRFRVEAKYSF